MTKFLAIASAKGGVGKTTAAINVGAALVNFGKDVVVVDANLSKPNISICLGTPKLSYTLHDALAGKLHVTDAAYLHPSGLRVIPGSMSINALKNITDLIGNLKNVVNGLAGSTHLVMLDTGAGLGKETLAALEASDEVIIVTTPDAPSVADALKTIKMAEEIGCGVLGVVVNKASGDRYEMSEKNIEAMLEKNILGIVADDISVKKSVAARQPLVYLYPDAPASIGFKKIAAQLMGQEYMHSLTKNF
ncbi:MAG: cell division ATPase MinD [Candidatus Woesearchaeota archaeon]|nr:cell division ATPase MinD [Candidatus Woesearchaeota archaeon]